MKYFFVLFLTISNLLMYAMDDNDNARSESKYLRIKINQNNDKRRKYAYICEICDKQVFDIVRHNRLHRSERPYICSICGQIFIESSACSKHIRRAHSDVENATYIVKFRGKEPYARFVKKKEIETTIDLSDILTSSELIINFLREQELQISNEIIPSIEDKIE